MLHDVTQESSSLTSLPNETHHFVVAHLCVAGKAVEDEVWNRLSWLRHAPASSRPSSCIAIRRLTSACAWDAYTSPRLGRNGTIYSPTIF